jgi:serine protease
MTRSLRLNALALATAMVFTGAVSAKDETSASAGQRLQLSGLKAGESYDRFIVKYADTSQMSLAGARDGVLNSAGRGVGVRASQLRQIATGGTVVQTDRRLSADEAAKFMAGIASSTGVEYVEPDLMMRPMMTPNDTRYGEQWHYFEATGGLNLPSAWDQSTGAGVVVAVIDTGYVTHSDLAANILPGYDFISDTAVSNDGNGRDSNPADPGDAEGGYPSSWHGTHVAGTIAAVTNNNKGVAGVAFNAKIVPVRVLGVGGGYTSDIRGAPSAPAGRG